MSETEPCAADNVQANLVRGARFADGRSPDWTLYFFFRIMAPHEVRETFDRARDPQQGEAGRAAQNERVLWLDFQNPRLAYASDAEGRRARREKKAQQPKADIGDPFRNWLKVLVSGQADDLKKELAFFPAEALAATTDTSKAGSAFRAAADLQSPGAAKVDHLDAVMTGLLAAAGADGGWDSELNSYGGAEEAGLKALEQGLAGVVRYEILRQGAPAFLKRQPAIRGERENKAPEAGAAAVFDPAPINIAFSWQGLKALGLDENTLRSFPTPFREGMASRARRLHDTGPSAPANWEGAFGLSKMHGYFTGGFLVGGKARQAPEHLWRRLRREVRAFNAPEAENGLNLRATIGALFRPLGLEILHIELGQQPYDVRKDKAGDEYASAHMPRVEHFGFRDGISQPFADLGLTDPRPGQTTPSRNRTWSPVAPGELYLNLPDEDGEAARLPANEKLRCHGTYVVFRKLEQDVVGFQNFLTRQAGGDQRAAERLGAEIVGRWRSGAPLVLSPDIDRTVDEAATDGLNDFLFAADDPAGAKCPLGSHVRRANPRDIGGRNSVRRHRLLRRSMSYGGPLLAPDSLGDGESRGLLFVAMNARIEQQFEVVQGEWLNTGEFLGQAGLGRCPLVGDHSGQPTDSFLRAGAVAPMTGLPSFVTLRGGEYFFAPGIEALRALAEGNETFPPDEEASAGLGLGGIRTQGLLDRDRLAGYARRIATSAVAPDHPSAKPVISLTLPDEQGGQRERMVFVGQNRDVKAVLSGAHGKGEPVFSVRPYHECADRMTRGHDLIISTDDGPKRRRLTAILERAWKTLTKHRPDVCKDMTDEIQARLAIEVRRCGPVGRIDLVHDLATAAAYGVVESIYGAPGPGWLTDLAVALSFGKQRIAELPADWLKSLKTSGPRNPAVVSLQTWSAIMLADIIANVQGVRELQALSAQAGSEMLTHIDSLLARSSSTGGRFTLADALVANAGDFVGRTPTSDHGDIELYETRAEYLRDAGVVLAEVTANTIAATPSAFGSVMQFLLERNLPLLQLAWGANDKAGPESTWPRKEALTPQIARSIIYECDRFNPVLPLLRRVCERGGRLPSGATVAKGDQVVALMGAANMDGTVFTEPQEFDLKRSESDYLMFGVSGGGRDCLGRRVAMEILSASLITAASLNDLRPVAGENGGPLKVLGALTVSLPARFTPTPPGAPRG